MDPAVDPTEILSNYEVDAAGFDSGDSLLDFHAIDGLAAAATRDHLQMVGLTQMDIEPVTVQSFLVSEAALVLVYGTDPGDAQNLRQEAVAR